MTVRAASGTRIEVTEQRIAEVEQLIREKLGKKNVQTIISEIGVTPDWSAAYTSECRSDGRRRSTSN